MARKQGDAESGKLGNKIYYTWHGRQCERSMPTSVANPRTEAQQAHRSNFAIVSKLSSYMKAAHLVGLHWHALREHNSTYAILRNTNKDCFTPDGTINLARVIVSYGTAHRRVFPFRLLSRPLHRPTRRPRPPFRRPRHRRPPSRMAPTHPKHPGGIHSGNPANRSPLASPLHLPPLHPLPHLRHHPPFVTHLNASLAGKFQ